MLGTNSQYMQKAHLHIVVLNLPYRLAMFGCSNTDGIIVLSFLYVALLGLILIINVNYCETKEMSF